MLVSKKGFTLIEVLVVVAIIGILAALGAPRIIGHINQARISHDIAVASFLNVAVEQWKIDNEPTSDLGGRALPQEWEDLRPYLGAAQGSLLWKMTDMRILTFHRFSLMTLTALRSDA